MTKIWEALDRMREMGWSQLGKGTHHGAGGCMSSALLRVYNCNNNDLAFRRDLNILIEVCSEQYPEAVVDSFPIKTIWNVNDDPNRRFEDIERIMTTAAIRADELV